MRISRPILKPQWRNLTCLLVALAALGGCDKAVDGSQQAASMTHRAFNDAVTAWDDVFTYHPKAPDQAPQTRYCYQLQSDVVCYDTVQANSTSKLVGYQDGDKISWVQPGGGSLGVSGGEAYIAGAASANRAAPYSPAFVANGTTVSTTETIRSTNLPPASR